MRSFAYLALFAMLAITVTADSVNVDVEAERHVMKQMNPVPSSFRKPLIDTSVSNAPHKKEALDKVAKIIAKEPAAATKPEKSLDEWNGEDETPEERDARQQKVLRNEIKSLKTLIKQGKDIIKILPSKQKRLQTLAAKLKKINEKKIKKAAAEKLAKQQQLLSQVAKQEAAIKAKLKGLKSTQGKLSKNIAQVKKILDPKGKKGKAKKGDKKGKSKKGDKKGDKKGKGKDKKKCGKCEHKCDKKKDEKQEEKKCEEECKKKCKKPVKKDDKKPTPAAKPAAPKFRSMRSDVELENNVDADAELNEAVQLENFESI